MLTLTPSSALSGWFLMLCKRPRYRSGPRLLTRTPYLSGTGGDRTALCRSPAALLRPYTKVSAGATCKTFTPVGFCVNREANVTSSRHEMQANRGDAQRTRRPDARSFPLRKKSTPLWWRINDETPLTFQSLLNFPMIYTLTVVGVNPNKEICREGLRRGRRPELNGLESPLSVIGAERPSASDAGRRAAAVIPFPSPIGRFLHLSPPLSKTWGELGGFLQRELPLAEHIMIKRDVVSGLAIRPFKRRGSWEFGQPFSILSLAGRERERDKQAI